MRNIIFSLAAIAIAIPAYAQDAARSDQGGRNDDQSSQIGNSSTLPQHGDRGDQVFALQVALDRARFSPGVIDGNYGRSTVKAVAAYQESIGVNATGELDGESWSRLTSDAPDALIQVRLDTRDLGPVGASPPAKPDEQAALSELPYGSIAEAAAEKYHTSPKAVAELNPGIDISNGAEITIPNVQGAAPESAEDQPVGGPFQARAPSPSNSSAKWQATLASLNIEPSQPQATRLIVDKSTNEVRAFDASDHLIAAFPATVGSTDNPSPDGELTIKGVLRNPRFQYDSEVLNEDGPRKRFNLPAGPNNLVGVVWIDLSKQHDGIHGTPDPEHIGQKASHGCVRLTNWDAARLSQMVKPGTQVLFR